jgi:hypothetical protein
MFDSFASESRFDAVGRWYDSFIGRDKWIETSATATSYTWHEDAETGGGDYVVNFIYQVNGEYFPGRFRSETIVDPGAEISIRYKPSNPRRYCVSGHYSSREPLLLGVIALCFLACWLTLKLMSLGRN